MELNIVHLFAENMNIYGDLGNILALRYRLEKRDIKINYVQVNEVADFLKIKDGDIFFWGGGQDSDQDKVAHTIFRDELTKKAFIEEIRNAVNANKIFLLICGGYQMFGEYYLGQNGERIPGLGILPIETYALSNETVDRCIGNIAIETQLPLKDSLLVGFENHSGQTKKKSDIDDLGKVKVGFGDNFEDKKEGVIYKNIFATYMHGPILPKNPEFTDYLLRLTLENKYGTSVTLDELDDSIENKARESIFKKLKIS